MSASFDAFAAEENLPPDNDHIDHKIEATFDRDKAMANSQAARGRLIGNQSFTDMTGQAVSLDEFADSPVLVNLIYTSCSHTCPMIVSSLDSALKAARAAGVGEELVVLTIGFDVAIDTPERMRKYKRDRGINAANWRFLSADQTTIDAFAQDLGFSFLKTPHGFEHIAQSSLIGPDGRVFRQIYGANFSPPVLVEPLKTLIYGETAGLTSFQGLADQLRLFCTVYDPASGRYRFDYSLLITIVVGMISLGAVAAFLIREFITSSRSNRTPRS